MPATAKKPRTQDRQPTEEQQLRARIADTAVEIFVNLWPDRTVDNLLCNPRDASKLCNAVRRQYPQAKDQQICLLLLNARKRKRIPANQRPRHRK